MKKIEPHPKAPPECEHQTAYSLGTRADGSKIYFCPSCGKKGKVLDSQKEAA
jgi:hypothetical protein